MTRKNDNQRLVTVCDKCLTASCWHGEFMCWKSHGAGLVNKAVGELLKLGLEHRDVKSTPKRPSMRKAINDKCKECIYDPVKGQGTWRKQVEDCASTKCPLYLLRPVSRGEKGLE